MMNNHKRGSAEKTKTRSSNQTIEEHIYTEADFEQMSE
jgi:hypothetical protein